MNELRAALSELHTNQLMNSLIPWWTVTRPVLLSRSKPILLSRITQAILALTVALPLATVPVQAQSQSGGLTTSASTGASTEQLQVDASPLNRNTEMISSFAPIVEKVGPSVVTVSTTGEVKSSNPLRGNPMFRRFFGMPNDSDGNGGQEKVEGLGSGIIVSSDGLILTNNHVAEAGDKIVVQLGDHGRQYDAKVVGSDPTSDLALLRIDAKDLPVITFADSDQVKVGDIVLAVGNPFGLTNTVTHGIVSAVGRGGVSDYQNFIQTDASINPGNSGGALVDSEGRLIGINSMIYTQSGGNEGIGFAVPSNIARNVIDSLLKYGKVSRGLLGVEPQELTPELAQAFNLSDGQQGALVAAVSPGSAAEKAGLKNGDIITTVNGKEITDPHSLRMTVGGMAPGDKVNITYLRNGQSLTTDATLGSESPQDEVAQTSNAPEQGRPNVLDGISIGNLDNDARTELKVPDDVKGVVVTDIDENSVGYDAGLRKGDVILEMNRTALSSADEAVTESDKIDKSDRVLLHVWSDGKSEYLVLKPKTN